MNRPALLVPLVCVGAASQGIGKLSVENARDVTSEGRVFVQTSAPRASYYEHELIPLRVRIGVEQSFLKGAMVQPFAQALDLPVQLQAPWLDAPDGAVGIDRPEHARGVPRTTFALNESIASSARVAEDLTAGARFQVLDVERTYAAIRAGTLVVPAPVVRFAYATRFEDDALNGRTAKDRVDAFVRGDPLSLEILALPEKGRPPEFGGAVGHFSIDADVSTREPELGHGFKLTLRIQGGGDLEHFDPPRIDLVGLSTLGTAESHDASRREIAYDLQPMNVSVREIPPIAFTYFDPEPLAGYRTVKTQPIRIEVRGAPPAERGERVEGKAPESGEDGVPAALWLGLLGAIVAAIGVALRRRTTVRNRT